MLAAPLSGALGQGAAVRLNEILAHSVTLQNPDGTITDWIELYNASAIAVDLADTSLTDTPSLPRRFVFPPGSLIGALSFRVVRCVPSIPDGTNYTGFGLKQSGGGVYFYDKPANGGALLDGINFGLQAADYSLGRFPNGTGNWGLNTPTPGATNAPVSLGPPSALRINEWMANPIPGKSDFIELYNPSAQPVSMGGIYLTDDLAHPTKFRVDSLSFIGTGQDGGFALFLADGSAGSGPDHLSFGLDAHGEQIGLYDANRSLIHSVSFGGQAAGVSEGFLPDGMDTRVFFPDTPSPGLYNRLLPALTAVVINELLTHTDPPLEDALELFNPTDEPVDLGGWLLTYEPAGDVSFEQIVQYRIPAPRIVPARGFAVFYEQELNTAVGMRFNSAHGGTLKLHQINAEGTSIAFIEQPFGPAQNGVSFGRYPTSDGRYAFVAMSTRSFGVDSPKSLGDFVKGRGLPNPGPKVGPIIISEVMYHPPPLITGGVTNDNPGGEYIELRNITGFKIALFDPAHPTNRWRLRDGVAFAFPAKAFLAPHEIVLVVPFDPVAEPDRLAQFQAQYDVPPAVHVFGPYLGELSNNSDSVELVKPDPPQSTLHPDVGFVPYVLVDKVRYRDDGPWPAAADGQGASLQRRNPNRFGNDVINWKAAPPTPGRPNGQPPALTIQPASHALVPGQAVALQAMASGTPPLFYQWRHDGTDIPGATDPTLLLTPAGPADAGNYSVIINNDDGSSESAVAVLRADTAQPKITIAFPGAGARLTNNPLVIRGTAKDDLALDNVAISLNGSEFAPATGLDSWSLTASLVPGTNVIVAQATDTGGNETLSPPVRVVFVVLRPMTLSFSHGTVAPDLSGALLEIGKSYSLKATPDSGYLFSRWNSVGDGDLGPAPTRAAIAFVMRSNLVLTAEFVANPFLPIKGTFAGLCSESLLRHESSAGLTLKLTDSGAYTATLQHGSKRGTLSGKFDLNGLATNHVAVDGTNVWNIELALPLADPAGALTGRVLGPDWSAGVHAPRAVFDAVAHACPYAGTYTLLIPGPDDETGAPWAGDGFAAITIGPGGAVSCSGALADGAKIAQKTSVAAEGYWPIYLPLDAGVGSLAGWLMLTNLVTEDLQGTLTWSKPGWPGGKIYPDGFRLMITPTGARYRAPSAAGGSLSGRILELTSGSIAFSGGALASGFTNQINLDANNRILNLSPNPLTLTFKMASGLFSGSVTAPGETRRFSFTGTVHQKGNFAGGYFLGTNHTGRVNLVP